MQYQYKHIQGNKNIAADFISQFPTIINQNTTHYSTYKFEIMSNIYNINQFPYGTCSLTFKIVEWCQFKGPYLVIKIKGAKYKTGFHVVDNNIQFVTY